MTIQTPQHNSTWQRFKSAIGAFDFSWKTGREYLVILLGALIQALAIRLFLIPGQLVSGGISGAAQIINHFISFPIGAIVFIGNIPLFFLGWRFLGGHRFAFRTAVAVGAFSLFTDLLVWVIPPTGVTQDNVLNALFGGVALGIGLGLVYRGGGTAARISSGASSITALAFPSRRLTSSPILSSCWQVVSLSLGRKLFTVWWSSMSADWRLK